VLSFLKIITFAFFSNPKLFFLRVLGNKRYEEIDPYEIFNLEPNLRVIIEAGAFNGLDTKKFSELYPNSSIFALEPNPVMFSKLNLLRSPSVNILQNALVVSSLTGQSVSFKYSEMSPSSSLLDPVDRFFIPSIALDKEVNVEGISLKDLYENYNLTSLDLIWLDLQGYEMQIIEDLFRNCHFLIKKVKLIQLEVSRVPLYKDSASFSEIHKLMKDFGFIDIIKRIPLNSGNVLYLNNSI
jgi:FkbM family methyltransferase